MSDDKVIRLVPNACGSKGAFSADEVFEKVKAYIEKYGVDQIVILGIDDSLDHFAFSTHNEGSMIHLMELVKIKVLMGDD